MDTMDTCSSHPGIMGDGVCLVEVKGHDPSHHRHREELHFLDEYGQPVAVQVEDRRGRGHRKRHADYAVERQWDALRAMGLVTRDDAHRDPYTAGRYYGHVTRSPDLYSDHMMMTPELCIANDYRPSMSADQPSANSYLPTISYSLDHLDRLDYQAAQGSPYQPNSENCLIGCYSTEVGPNRFHRQADFSAPWRADRSLGYLPLSELDSGLGCGPDSPQHHLHQMVLSEAETDAVSSLPGHTPSSPGSSPSSESLLSSEPSDSGFHSVSTGEFRRFHKMHGSHAHRHAPPHRPGHSPREQRGRWDLESIPETTQVNQASRCTVGNSVTTTVQFHRAEKSPTLPRQHPPSIIALGCHTEPCQRRVLWSERRRHQRRGGTIDTPGRSQTLMDLSDRQRPRRASHPNMNQTRPPGTPSPAPGPRSAASCTIPDRPAPPQHLQLDLLRLREERRRSGEEDSLSKSPGSASSHTSDGRGVQTLGNRTSNPRICYGPHYSTLAVAPHSPRSPHSPPSPHSPSSPRCRLSDQRAVRNQLLRARASRLARERSEVTTDEETRGDGVAGGVGREEERHRAGRYWSRTERRRHAASSRQHRERRVCGAEEQGGGGQGLCSSQTVLELSHRKQNRLRNSKLLDDWTTVEELLSHGTRVETDGQLCRSPLLSVTTV
ncbi:PDZ domain-containing protein 4 [Merluccius polli]|uniref:PDZ domain-containing protein 4 n=1 Tax=Merluccius polli TaxID=89951 RepID=A0AA47MUG6_MERPO|nr:PDZ domain-containing protein 4 [Merluccius polli]